MPNQPKTPLRRLRVDDDLWEAFGATADPDRSAVIRDFMRWFIRERGATLPRQPGPGETVPPCEVCGFSAWPEGGMHAARSIHMRDHESPEIPRTVTEDH